MNSKKEFFFQTIKYACSRCFSAVVGTHRNGPCVLKKHKRFDTRCYFPQILQASVFLGMTSKRTGNEAVSRVSRRRSYEVSIRSAVLKSDRKTIFEFGRLTYGIVHGLIKCVFFILSAKVCVFRLLLRQMFADRLLIFGNNT